MKLFNYWYEAILLDHELPFFVGSWLLTFLHHGCLLNRHKYKYIERLFKYIYLRELCCHNNVEMRNVGGCLKQGLKFSSTFITVLCVEMCGSLCVCGCVWCVGGCECGCGWVGCVGEGGVLSRFPIVLSLLWYATSEYLFVIFKIFFLTMSINYLWQVGGFSRVFWFPFPFLWSWPLRYNQTSLNVKINTLHSINPNVLICHMYPHCSIIVGFVICFILICFVNFSLNNYCIKLEPLNVKHVYLAVF